MQAHRSDRLRQDITSPTGGQLAHSHTPYQQAMGASRTDVYSCYEIGLENLLRRVGDGHLHFQDVLRCEQRLRENIGKARKKDTDTLQADRISVIEELNEIAWSSFSVSFNDLGNPHRAQKLDVHEAKIETTDEESLPSFQLKLTEPPPENVAILHVYSCGSDQYRMMVKNVKLGELHTEPLQCPSLVLEQMNMEASDADECIEQAIWPLQRWSDGRPIRRILSLLNRLREISGGNAYLVIVDSTNFEIPWEMLTLPFTSHAPHLEQGYLGALISVARWQGIDDQDSDVSPPFEHEECAGNIMAYTDQEHATADKAISTLNMLNAIYHNNIRKLYHHLQQAHANNAMIYLTYQGFFSRNLNDIALGPVTDKRQRISLAKLEILGELPLLRMSRSIIFINASHSGRLLHDKYVPDGRLRGFPEFFLGRGARGVIGILGEVAREHTSEIGHLLLEEMRQSPHLPVATSLSNVRARIVKSLPPDPELHDWLRVISVFRYVYYGNPMAALRFTKQEGTSDV